MSTSDQVSGIVYTGYASDEARIISVMVLAFSRDPAARWLYRDPHQYLASWPDFVRAFGGEAFKYGAAHYTDGYTGAALWLPPGAQPDEHELVALIQRTANGDVQGDVFGVLEQMGRYHPSEPHWYLPLIGVEPVWQGKGLGSALLKHALAACDREHQPAYLESSNPANIPLYERHGFEVIGLIQAGASPPLYPMVRRPQ